MAAEAKSSVIALTLYSRSGCHLCDEMKAIIERVARSFPLALETVDISTDPQLEGLYGHEIPVLMIDGKKAAKYRITEAELRRQLEARGRGAGTAGEAR
jgi:thiol-disulfide isomerase/thioredoxin